MDTYYSQNKGKILTAFACVATLATAGWLGRDRFAQANSHVNNSNPYVHSKEYVSELKSRRENRNYNMDLGEHDLRILLFIKAVSTIASASAQGTIAVADGTSRTIGTTFEVGKTLVNGGRYVPQVPKLNTDNDTNISNTNVNNTAANNKSTADIVKF